MDEFELIGRYFAGLTPPADDVVLGVGDDCALLAPPPGLQLAVTTDTLIGGRHFPEDTAAADVGWKSLAVNLSDLAAMGAQARWFTLALSLPQADAGWVAGFAQGLRELASVAGVSLVGGDTARGPLSITVTAMGWVPPGAALLRSGARVGDRVCVSGTLGDAALALQRRSAPPSAAEGDEAFLRRRLDRPRPRLELGLALRGIASAALDLSDGLAGDLAHILRASGGLGARIQAQALPRSQAFGRMAPPDRWLALQAGGGDDYELCVCVHPERLPAAAAAAARVGVAFTDIGVIVQEPGLVFVDRDGRSLPSTVGGYRHF